MASHLPGKLLKEVKNGVVSSGITMEEEDSVPKSGLMPVKQFMIHQNERSQSAPPVQPYRKSSSGLSQPKKVTFGSATIIDLWTHVSYRKYGKRHLSTTAGSPTPFEVAANSAIAERKIVKHPIIEEEVDKEGSELGA